MKDSSGSSQRRSDNLNIVNIMTVADWTQLIAYSPASLRKAVWRLLLALSFMTIFAVSLVPPNVDGVEFTVRVQLAPAPKVFGLMWQFSFE